MTKQFHAQCFLFCFVFDIFIRVTSLVQLSLAEFGGEYKRLKVYENGYKNRYFVQFGIECQILVQCRLDEFR